MGFWIKQSLFLGRGREVLVEGDHVLCIGEIIFSAVNDQGRHSESSGTDFHLIDQIIEADE